MEERASALAISEGLLQMDGSLSPQATNYLLHPPRMVHQYIKGKRTPDGPMEDMIAVSWNPLLSTG